MQYLSLLVECQSLSLVWCWRSVQKRLDNGSLVKVRLDNQGIASGLYETMLKPMHKLALSGQFDATNMEKPPKVCLLTISQVSARQDSQSCVSKPVGLIDTFKLHASKGGSGQSLQGMTLCTKASAGVQAYRALCCSC